MAYLVKMPNLGMEMQEGEVIEWYLDAGDPVAEGDIIAEIESEKTVREIEAREPGILESIYLNGGDVGEPGAPMGLIARPGEDTGDLEAAVDVATGTDDRTREESRPRSATSTTTDTDSPAVKSTPKAKKRASELDVDLSRVEGTGIQDSVTAEDVERFVEERQESDSERGGGIPLTLRTERSFDGIRRTIARRLGKSYDEAVHVTEHRTVDAEALLDATEAADACYDVDVSISDTLLICLSAALDGHPEFNAAFEDDVHRIYEEHNVGVAVDVDEGLIAPVIPKLQEKSIAEVAETRRAVVRRVLDGEYTMADLSNSTFTVTNLGSLGVESFTPIINPPNIAILGVNAIRDEPVVDGDEITPRKRLPLDLSFDHRVVDGADAARFLQTITETIEDPWSELPAEVR